MKNILQLRLASVDGRCIIAHCASWCCIFTKTSTVSATIACTTRYASTMRLLPRRPTILKSNTSSACKPPIRPSTSFKPGLYNSLLFWVILLSYRYSKFFFFFTILYLLRESTRFNWRHLISLLFFLTYEIFRRICILSLWFMQWFEGVTVVDWHYQLCVRELFVSTLGWCCGFTAQVPTSVAAL